MLKKRYDKALNAGMICIGNTLGLSKLNGDIDIGAFISLDRVNQAPGYPPGTTFDYKENSSSSELMLDSECKIEYAELIWAGSIKSDTEDVSAEINTPILFETPSGEYEINPDSATSQEYLSHMNEHIYVRSCVVTNLLNNDFVGTFSVKGVPATIGPSKNFGFSNCCGWTLVVIYSKDDLPFRHISLFVGYEDVTANKKEESITIPIYDIKNNSLKLCLNAIKSYPYDAENSVYVEDSKKTYTLSCENNLKNKFFVSQINSEDGNVDENATFSNLNAIVGQNRPGVRIGWDIASINVPIKDIDFKNNVNLKFATIKQTYLMCAIGIQSDLKIPNLNISQKVDKDKILRGSILNYTITLSNEGESSAVNLEIDNFLPKQCECLTENIEKDGKINIQSIQPKETVEINFKARLKPEASVDKIIKNTAKLSYEYNIGEKSMKYDLSAEQLEISVEDFDVSINQSVSSKECIENADISYFLEITNNCNVDIESICLRKYLSPHMELKSINIDDKKNVFEYLDEVDLGVLKAHENMKIVINATIGDGIRESIIKNTPMIECKMATLKSIVNKVDVYFSEFNVHVRTPKLRIIQDIIEKNVLFNETNEYRLYIENIGDINLKNIDIQLQIDEDILVVDDAFKLDGKAVEIYNNVLKIPEIGAGVKKIFEFKGKINNKKECVKWSVDGIYNVIIDDKKYIFSTDKKSSTYKIYDVNMQMQLISDKHVVMIDDTIDHEIVIKNIGNLDSKSSILSVKIPDALQIENDSIYFNGEQINKMKNLGNFSIPEVLSGEEVKITFKTIALKPMQNEDGFIFAYIKSSFLINEEEIKKDFTCKKVKNIRVENIDIAIENSCNKDNVYYKDILNFNITIDNNSTIDLENAIMKSSYTHEIEYVEGTLTVNGKAVDANPYEEIVIDRISKNDTCKINFDARVRKQILKDEIEVKSNLLCKINLNENRVININKESEQLNIVVRKIDAEIVSSISKNYIMLGEEATYNLTIKNIGNVDIEKLVLNLNLPQEIQFVERTFCVNENVVLDMDVYDTIQLNNIKQLEEVKLKFNIKSKVLPEKNPIIIDAYILSIETLEYSLSEFIKYSNEVELNIKSAKLEVEKFADKTVVIPGDIITYKVHITNKGNVAYGNAIFREKIVEDFNFVKESVYVNSINRSNDDVNMGIRLGNIQPNEELVVSFQMIANNI